jgi:hypothetical protein
LQGFDGDPNLYVQLGKHNILFGSNNGTHADCSSTSVGVLDQCRAGPATSDNTRVFVGVSAYRATQNYTIDCQIGCRRSGTRCSSQAQCCGAFPFALACDGPPLGSRTCKDCVEFGYKCSRNSQCCQALKCGVKWGARGKRCVLANDRPHRRTFCKRGTECSSDGDLELVCDGPTIRTKECKPCYRGGSHKCTRSTQCCPGLTCRHRKCQHP